jgi:hypothetical protein
MDFNLGIPSKNKAGPGCKIIEESISNKLLFLTA